MPQICKERTEAILAGKTRYRLEKPCKFGHYAERLVTTYACLECRRVKQRKGTGRPSEKRRDSAEPWVPPVPRYLIDIDPQRSHRGERLATAFADDRPVFAMVTKTHSAEQVAARLVALGYDDAPVVVRYGDIVGIPKPLFSIARAA